MKSKVFPYMILFAIIAFFISITVYSYNVASNYNEDDYDKKNALFKKYAYTDYKYLSNEDKELMDTKSKGSSSFKSLSELYIKEKNTEDKKELIEIRDKKVEVYERLRDFRVMLIQIKWYCLISLLFVLGLMLASLQIFRIRWGYCNV